MADESIKSNSEPISTVDLGDVRFGTPPPPPVKK